MHTKSLIPPPHGDIRTDENTLPKLSSRNNNQDNPHTIERIETNFQLLSLRKRRRRGGGGERSEGAETQEACHRCRHVGVQQHIDGAAIDAED
jgi:hypothetical protein